MSVFTFTLNVALNRSHITVCTACPINILLFVVSHSGDRLGNCPCPSPVLIIYHSTHYSLINTARNFFSKLFADHVQVACHTHDIQRRDHVTSRRERWPLEWELRVTLRYHDFINGKCSVESSEGNRSSRSRVISPKIMSPETWVMLSEI